MATLERVMQMKGDGLSDNQIIQTLRQEGMSPREINESLSQSQIKNALGSGYQEPSVNQMEPPNIQQPGMYNQDYSRTSFSEYQGEEAQAPPAEEGAPGVTQEYYPDYAPQQNLYQEYQPQQPFDIETISEMVEQAIEEKNETLKKQIASFTKFKEDSAMELDKMNQRLQKIENTISELQMAVLRKVGEYGGDIHAIAQEMRATQNTFSKIVDPLTDNIRELRDMTDSMRLRSPVESSVPSEQERRERSVKKPGEGFENFLR